MEDPANGDGPPSAVGFGGTGAPASIDAPPSMGAPASLPGQAAGLAMRSVSARKRRGRKTSVNPCEAAKQDEPSPQSSVLCSLICTNPVENGANTPFPSDTPLASSWQPMHEPANRARDAMSSGVSPVPASRASMADRNAPVPEPR